MANTSRNEIIRTLAERIQEIESAMHRPERCAFSPAIPVLENLLPEKQLPAGSLMELLSAAEGTGAWTVALIMAKQACEQGKALVVTDSQRCFYPPAAASLGIDLDRLIVLRPAKPRDLYAGVEQSLRCAAVGAVVAWFDRLPGTDGRRLQLAAESGGGMGFFLRPKTALRTPSFATLRLLITAQFVNADNSNVRRNLRRVAQTFVSVPDAAQAGMAVPPIRSALVRDSLLNKTSASETRRITIEVVRCRGGKPGRSVILEIEDETGHVHVLPEMAAPAPVQRSAPASG
jgi:protein ImuA